MKMNFGIFRSMHHMQNCTEHFQIFTSELTQSNWICTLLHVKYSPTGFLIKSPASQLLRETGLVVKDYLILANQTLSEKTGLVVKDYLILANQTLS